MELIFVRNFALASLVLVLASCMSTPQTAGLESTLPQESQKRVVVDGVPFYPQEDYQCGPAALATLLSFQGGNVLPSMLVDDVFVPGRNGSFQLEMLAAARSHGRLAYKIDQSLTDVLLEVEAGNPVLVLQNLSLRIRPQWHFAVVKGYDYGDQTVILNSGTIENYKLPMKTFERTWERADHWAVVVQRPGSVPATADPDRYFQALVDLQHSHNETDVTELAYEAGLERWPQHKQLLLGLGNHLLEREQYREAADTYAIAVAHYPDYSPALNNLAHALWVLGEAESALAFAQQAVVHAEGFRDTYEKTYDEIIQSIENSEKRR